MSRLVVRAGLAAGVICAINSLLIVLLPILLPYWKPVWLINPLVGMDVAPSGGGTSWDLALSIALGVSLVLVVSVYLDHCVIDQPAWAMWLGWGVLVGGALTSTAQDVAHSSRTLYIDVYHHLGTPGEYEVTLGAAVVFLSWLRAPELFSPHVRRRVVLGWIAAATVAGVAGERIGIPWTMSSLFVLAFAVLTGGTLIMRSEQAGGRPGSSEHATSP
jgi:hypothetical protein